MLTHFYISFGHKLIPFLVNFNVSPTKLVKTPAKKRKMGLKLIRVKRIKKTLVNLQPMGT